MRKFWLAVTTLIGTIIGAGILGIPYAVAGPGVLVGIFYLVGLGGIMLLLHLIFGEIVLRTEEKHRLVGYASKYLGKKGKFIATVIDIIGIYGSILIFIILGGELLSLVLPGGAFLWSLVTFIFGAVMILGGRGWISRVEFLVSGAIAVMIILFFFTSIGSITFENISYIRSMRPFLPFGVILYALMGFTAIPEIREILSQDGKNYKRVIILGTVVPIVLYLLFFISIVGVSGTETTPEPLQGLISYFGKGIVKLGAVFGFLSIITSFFVTGLYLKNTFNYDYKIPKLASWFLVISIPIVIFVAGIRDFINVLSFTGAVLAGAGGHITS